MYELVNTSLPNGLIAGTHGFSTVAMTKGLSDIVRGRLESLCAYTHRTSAHDETYFRENPVNWFHVMLPQGDHVVGRVAPSDFDYTGRTNRIARLRVFSGTEMPEIGGAGILRREAAWFESPWEGEPRYLAEDKNTCGQLKMLPARKIASAPAWDALFGNGGTRFAQQFAMQLEKNIGSGKATYFKTSTGWDVSGTKLLGLFEDLINLLPPNVRSKVTFSTYPIALPAGMFCNLRGIYDRDRFFYAASAAQPWVDCENAKIVNAELFPVVRQVEKKVTAGLNISDAAARAGRFETTQGTIASALKGDPAKRSETGYQEWATPQKEGFNRFALGLSAAIAAIAIIGCGLMMWMVRENKRQMSDSGVLEALETQQKENELEEKRKADAAEEKQRLAEREEAERQRIEVEKQKQAEEKAKMEAEERAKAEAVKTVEPGKIQPKEETKPELAFLEADEIRLGKPQYVDPDKDEGNRETSFKKEDGCCVYYYVGDVLTNEVAGMDIRKTGTTRRGVLKFCDDLSQAADNNKNLSGVVIWYNKQYKRAFIDFSHRKAEEGKEEKWFENNSVESVDLAEKVFGKNQDILTLWKKFRAQEGKKVSYVINYTLATIDELAKSEIEDAELNKDNRMEVEEATMTLDDAVTKIGEAKIRELNAQIDRVEETLSNLKGELKDFQEKRQRSIDLTNTMWNASCKVAKLEGKIKESKDKKEIEKLTTQKKKILDGENTKSDYDLEQKIKRATKDVDEFNDKISAKGTEIREKEANKQNLENQREPLRGRMREIIKQSSFVVRAKGDKEGED